MSPLASKTAFKKFLLGINITSDVMFGENMKNFMISSISQRCSQISRQSWSFSRGIEYTYKS